ncbi:asparagine synthase (glutamine-hydrolyzing) [Ferruginibacter lapsinanis]|uniref:asparagine synthase (glutamine-hydrolyzing) n=1 Tax=Ferruginibacter lapsinanis TaxID=563172 RepID=UPI001E37B9CA|nr:asparagine synthase (glutamine-hydrolyzing) [Ferruginibacter lapsinanis]UEG49478.1 asparagine synthase (glutamine-hydrolyzing) [Ferruginibacter lapsinanis]
MCRIAGVINPVAAADLLKQWVTDMCQLQQHGGPDDQGIYSSGQYPVVLGHRRLSVIDLSEGGHQPMQYADGKFCISYNGELYNYLDLKAELKIAGCHFVSNSDTEVILAAFTLWGENAFKKFNGMFAFALLNNHSGELFLVRDASGIKPLYYADTKEGLVFASEIKGFRSIPYLQTKSNHWQVYLMAYGHLPEPITTLHEVKPLQKGTYLKYNINTLKSSVNTFESYNYVEKITNRDEALELLKHSLQSAVKRHLLADAPIGVFLSGGLDSSIIALLANSDKQTRLKTVSVFFEDNKYSEKKYQDLLQEKLFCEQFQHLVKEEQFHEHFPSIVKAMDMPSCDGINTWFISKFAKESGLKAVLSGIGGDELFGGYPSFNRILPTLLLQKLPNEALKAGRYVGLRRFKRLQYLSIEGAVGRYLFLRGQFIPSEIAKHLNANESEIWQILNEQPTLPNIDYLTPKNQASWMEMNMYMQNQLLRDADVMSMAHGVEIRVPFLDAEFVKLSLQIQSQIKYSGSHTKQMLIDAFKDILPEAIWKRPKMGFAFPFKEWLSNDEYAKSNSANHKEFVSGNIHWSQFLTLLLIERNGNA